MKLLKSVAELIGAIIVFPLWFAVGMLYTLLKHILLWDYSLSKQLAPIIEALALSLDGIANAGAGEMMNDNFIKNNEVSDLKYGRWAETISANTGQNQIRGNLTETGDRFRRLIDGFFRIFGQKDHCKNAK